MFLKEYSQRRSLKELKTLTHKRESRYRSLQEIESLLFLFNFEEEGILETIKRVIEILDNRKIKFDALGINLEKLNYPTESLDPRVKVLNRENLKYGDVPDRQKIASILTKNYHLLIDFSAQYHFTNHYISLASSASFKIGRHNYKGNPYNLIIETKKGGESRSYLNSIIHYLSSINSL